LTAATRQELAAVLTAAKAALARAPRPAYPGGDPEQHPATSAQV